MKHFEHDQMKYDDQTILPRKSTYIIITMQCLHLLSRLVPAARVFINIAAPCAIVSTKITVTRTI